MTPEELITAQRFLKKEFRGVWNQHLDRYLAILSWERTLPSGLFVFPEYFTKIRVERMPVIDDYLFDNFVGGVRLFNLSFILSWRVGPNERQNYTTSFQTESP